jgi:hypothetical protein
MFTAHTFSKSHSTSQHVLALVLCLALSLVLPLSALAQKKAARVGEPGSSRGRSAKSRGSKRATSPGNARVKGRAAQEESGARRGELWTGERGVTETVAEIMAREAQNKKRVQRELEFDNEPEHELPEVTTPNPDSPAVPQWPVPESSLEQQRPLEILSPQTIGTNFDGVSRLPGGESGNIPPDSVGDVGPTQILVASNGRIKVFSKAGVLGGLNATLDTFFNSVRNAAGTTDPHIRYDRLTQRWFVVIINLTTTNNRVLVAVSSGPTIVSSASFTFFFFQHNTVAPAGDAGLFADYPTLGVDKNALYIGTNNFTSAGAFSSTTGFVVQKTSVLGAGPIVVSAFRNLHSCGIGMLTPQGVDNDDPASTEGYFIGISACLASTLTVRRITTPGATPAISAGMNITVPITSAPASVVAQGVPSFPLDAVGDRLMAAHMRKNKDTGVSSLWTAHSIRVNSSGVGAAGGGRNGSRWYEFRNLTSTPPTLFQSGTLFDSAASNPRSFWMMSIAGSGQGHMALGCTFASVNDFASIAAAGRLSSDTLGTTQTFTIAQAGTQPYDDLLTNPQRWGDYSQTVVDPNDDMTMWTFQEYCNNAAQAGWAVRVTQLVAPPPATPASSSSGIVTQNIASTTITITGTVVSGSGFFDPGADTGGPGFANHISASVSGGVTVNSITYNSPTSVTLNISTVGASLGPKNVTITNPDGQSRTGNNLFTVQGPTAAEANIGGRVTTASGVPLPGVTLTLLDTANSNVSTTVSGADGRYVFNNAAVGDDYLVTPARFGFNFSPSNQGFAHVGERLNVDFAASVNSAQARAVNFDFDGDRKSDISVFRPGEAIWYIIQSQSGTFKSVKWGMNGDRIVPADYDGDGKTDIAVFRPSTGDWYIINSQSGTFTSMHFGLNGDIPVPGYYDADNRADVAVFRPSHGAWYIMNSADNSFRAQPFGLGADLPVAGDYDGDGLADLAVFRPSEATWYIRASGSNAPRAHNFGLASDILAPADYDGDGKTDVAVFRNTDWIILNSLDGTSRSATFGLNADRPAPADYDGDGKADIAVFRASEGNWYLLQSSNNGLRAEPWGAGGDVPAPSAYIP